MVKRIISFLGREISGLHEAAYLLGVFAISSQILALVRDRLLAHTFGASQTLDLYYAAFRIPDFLFAVIASLFSASILIPFLTEKVKVGVHVGREFLSAAFSVFLLVIIVVSAAVFFLIPHFADQLFPGFAIGAERDQIILLTRILLLSPILLGLSNLLASVTQLYNRFFIYGISPILYNIGIIIGVLFFAEYLGPAGLAWGVILGAVLHVLVQAPFVISQGLMPRFILSFRKYRDLLGLFMVALPRTLALSAQEVSKFFLISLASLMSVGSISVFSLSFNLQSVPLTIVGVSYSLAAFPSLALLFASGNKGKFVELLQTTARYIIFFSLPLIALFVVLRAHIVRVILGSGYFSWQDTRLTAAALALFVISLAAQGLILLFTRARYAAGNTKTPFYINICSTVFTIVAAAVLVKLATVFPGIKTTIEALFRVADVPGTDILILPIAFSLGSLLGSAAHVYTFERDYGGVFKVLVMKTLEVGIVAVIMGMVTYAALNIVDNIFSLDTFFGIFGQGVIAGACGALCGIILLALIGSRELKEVLQALHKKFWKTPVIGPDPTV